MTIADMALREALRAVTRKFSRKGPYRFSRQGSQAVETSINEEAYDDFLEEEHRQRLLRIAKMKRNIRVFVILVAVGVIVLVVLGALELRSHE